VTLEYSLQPDDESAICIISLQGLNLHVTLEYSLQPDDARAICAISLQGLHLHVTLEYSLQPDDERAFDRILPRDRHWCYNWRWTDRNLRLRDDNETLIPVPAELNG
jgi:hypothetical protein